MAIITVTPNTIGQSGQVPSLIYIATNSSTEDILTTGFLNPVVESFGIALSDTMLAIVTTKETPNARASSTNVYGISFINGNYSLVDNSSGIFPIVVDPDGDLSNIRDLFMSGDLIITTDNNIHGSIQMINTGTDTTDDAALVLTTNAGPSGLTGGNPRVTFVQGGFNNWVIGVWSQNTGGDNYLHIGAGAFSSDDALIIQGDGTVLTANGDVAVNKAIEVGEVNLTVTNTSNAITANSAVIAQTTGNGGNTLGGIPSLKLIHANESQWQIAYWPASASGDNNLHFHKGSSGLSVSDPMVLDGTGNASFQGTVSADTFIGLSVPYAGENTANGGGSTTETINVTGMILGDSVLCTFQQQDNAAYVVSAACSNGSFLVTYSADPGPHVLQWRAWHN